MKNGATPITPPDQDNAQARRLTPRHALWAGLLLATATTLALVLPSSQVEAKRTLALELPPAVLASPAADNDVPATPDTQPVDSAPATESWQTTQVRTGDSLFEIFKRNGLAIADLPVLLKSGPEASRLKTIHPGDTLQYQADANGQLLKLQLALSPLSTLVFERDDNGRFQSNTVTRTPEVRQAYRQATITSSLFAAGQTQGMSQSLLMELADIFSGVVDFALDVRAGDQFGLVYEEQYIDGKRLGTGRILAAYFTNDGDTYRAYYYTDADGNGGYYNEDGISMRKAFLRAPLDFTRVSSGFNPKRLHPVFKTMRPHNGIDYAAPLGTPVYAAGDGRVIESGYSKANGNYIFIQHGAKYVTRYLHLSKRLVKTGQRVSQRQVIGKVGATGYATGPHLHYEFLVNGVHYNPRTIVNQLPSPKVLDDAEKQRFLASTNGIRLQLATLSRSNLQLAANRSVEQPL